MARPLAEAPFSLLWSLAVLLFGVLAMVCVLVLLRRQAQSPAPWRAGDTTERGRHLQHLARVLRAIRAINKLVVGDVGPQKLLQGACQALTETRGYKMAWVGLLEEGEQGVVPVAQAGFDEGELDEDWATCEESPATQAVRSGEPRVMRDVRTASQSQLWKEKALAHGCHSSAAVPLSSDGRVLGAMNVYCETPNVFDIEEVELLREVSNCLAHGLRFIKLWEEVTRARRGQGARICSVLEHCPVGVISTDAEGIITGLNRRMIELLGRHHAPEVVVDRVKLADLALLNGPYARRQVQQLFSGREPVSFECRAPSAQGDGRVLRWQGVPACAVGGSVTGAIWLVEELMGGSDEHRA